MSENNFMLWDEAQLREFLCKNVQKEEPVEAPRGNIKQPYTKELSGEKWCSGCKKHKIFTEFHKSTRRSTGVNAYCKPCASLREKKRPIRHKPKEQAKRHKVRSLYNLSMKEYEFISNLRGNVCPICDTESKTMVLDHDHSTNTARDCICQRCNLLLGLVEKKEGIIPKSEKYIHFNKTNPKWYSKMLEEREG